MKLYELTYLIPSDLADEELKTFSQKIDNFVQTEEGIVKKASSLMKRKLGYLIEKKEVVYLATLNFQLNPEKIENLEKKLKAEKSILRYIILGKKVPKAIKVPIKLKTLPPKPSRKAEKPKKVELKEIEKKLEEILE